MAAVASRNVGTGAITPLGMPPRPNTGERLTPMPDYMRPVTQSAQRKFKKLHEDHMMGKLREKRVARKEQNQKTREEAKKIMQKIPIELLAKEWMKDTKITLETRAYLIDKILPTLILGLEKVLNEAQRRDLTEKEELDENFNPVNYLAQYLMRNNPRYSNFSEASPYIRGLREISEELKTQLFDIEENKLARIKMEARRKREEREKEERLVQEEKARRENLIRSQFTEWNVGLYPEGRVKLALLQNALRSFAEISQLFPEQLKQAAAFSHQLEPTDDTGKMIPLKDFIIYLKRFIDDMPREVFDEFMAHMSRCARAYRSQAEMDQRKVLLTQLFANCDHTGVGQIDRHRILDLFAMFFDKAQGPIKENLRNPRRWPVVDHEFEEFTDDEDEKEEDAKPAAAAAKPAAAKPATEAAVQQTDDNAVHEPHDPVSDPAAAEEKEEVGPDQDQEKPPSPMPGAPVHKAEPDNDVQQPQTLETKDQPKVESQPKEEPESAGQKEEDKGLENITEEEEPKEEVSEVEKPASPKEKTASPPPPKTPSPPPAKEIRFKDVPEKKEYENEAKLEKEASEMSSAMTPKPPASSGSEQMMPSGDDEFLEQAIDDDEDTELPVTKPLNQPEPPNTQQSRVSFADGTEFKREPTLLSGSRSQASQASVFDENTLTNNQFISVTETFLGDLPDMDAFQHLVRFIKEGYVETEEERMSRLMKAKQEQRAAKRKNLLNSLFEMWDNDGSGFLDTDEVLTVMKKYKDGMDNEHIDKARKDTKRKTKYHDNRLSKREFRDLFYKIVEYMGGDDNFDFFIEFLLSSVERTYQERVRGEARKKWLQQIIKAGETSGAAMEPVYKSIFQALYKDAEAHGNQKIISAYIGLLERNDDNPDRGDVCLRYTATTQDNAPYMLNKCLYKDMKGVSYSVIESGKPIHVPRVNNHGNIHFWHPEHPDEEHDGSLIVVPLKDKKKRVFGLMGIDTLMDPKPRSIFITHEIQFFQGVAKAFSIAYHHVDIRQKTMRISESAISWIHRRSPHVNDIVVYMVEPDNKSVDFVLRRMMATDHKGMATTQKNPPRLERKDNLFRDYLFKCVDNSESVTADAYGERHLAIPLRDDTGRAIVVIDISIGKELKALPKAESREVMKMLKLLQTAYKQIARESDEAGIAADGLDDEEEVKAEILFDRLMLMELRENVAKLDATAYAELKSYKEPPPVVHLILKAVLAMFFVDKAMDGEFDDWDRCKKYVGPKISQSIMAIDPTLVDTTDHIPVELINSYLNQVPHGAVAKQGSLPSQYLYNWVFVCVSLIEHTRKNRGTKKAADKKKDDDKDKKEEAEEAAAPKSGEQAATGEQQKQE